jgi:urease accessory protein
MIKLLEKSRDTHEVAGRLCLTFAERQRSRLRARSDAGDDIGIFMERGTVLSDGDYLRSETGQWFRVDAAPEPVSVVRCAGRGDLARAAYHLGNRHVQLQVDHTYLAYQPDHVLDEMVRGLGFSVVGEERPFEPESGAYPRGSTEETHAHAHHSIAHEYHSHAHHSPTQGHHSPLLEHHHFHGLDAGHHHTSSAEAHDHQHPHGHVALANDEGERLLRRGAQGGLTLARLRGDGQ